MFSHSSAYAVTAHERNVPDEILFKVKRNRGIVMVTFFPSYVSEETRLAWAALTDYVDREDVGLLFGCSSFAGVEAGAYLDAFADLRARHLAPDKWQPGVRASEVFRFGADVTRVPDRKRAAAQMPPLLRTYLLMGGWVSDHAVVDREMNTLHVFTGVEVGAIPESRKRLLRALV